MSAPKRTLVRFVALMALVALLAACGGAAQPTPTPAGPAEPTPTPDPLAGWITFTAPNGSFTVRLPKEPDVQNETVPTEAGDIDLAMYIVETSDSVVMVSYNGFPAVVADVVAAGDPAVIQSMLDSGRDGAVANVSGTLQDEKQLTVAGFPARDFTFTIDASVSPTGKAALGMARAILTKDGLYQLMSLAAADKADPTMVQAFFESFQLRTGQ